jgi:2'-5' RNA ligase
LTEEHEAPARERWRLFIGLPPSDEARAELVRRTARLHEVDPRARWVIAPNLHVTLLFLGDRDRVDVAPIAAAIKDVAREHEPYLLELDGAGSFGGGQRGRTVWLRVGRGRVETAELANDLSRVLLDEQSEDQGAEARPHLTLARVASGALVARASDMLVTAAIGWRVERVQLYRSRLGHGPPVYEELAAVRLGASPPRA